MNNVLLSVLTGVWLALAAALGALPVAAGYPQLPPANTQAAAPVKPLPLPMMPTAPTQVVPPPPPGGSGQQFPQLPPAPVSSGNTDPPAPISTVPAQPAEPPINNPFSNMENTVFISIKDATNLIFNSSWYWTFAWVTVVGATLLALYRILWRSAAALAGGSAEGMVQFVLFDAIWVILIQQLTLRPNILLEPIFSAFEFANALGDQLLFDQTNGAATITELLNATANAVGSGYMLNGFGSYQVAWVLTFGMMLLMGALYYFQFVTGCIYLYFVMPFLMRPALAGLLTRSTDGWFATVLNTGLTQVLKPLIAKSFLWFTFCILNVAVAQVAQIQVPGVGAVPLIGNLANAPARSIGMLAVYVMVLIFGILLQGAVPTVAKMLSLTINGASGDLADDLGGKGLGLLLAGTSIALRAGSGLGPLLDKQFSLPKSGGMGLKKKPGVKTVNGEVINEPAAAPTGLGVDRQFKGGSPKQLQLGDGTTSPKPPGLGGSGGGTKPPNPGNSGGGGNNPSKPGGGGTGGFSNWPDPKKNGSGGGQSVKSSNAGAKASNPGEPNSPKTIDVDYKVIPDPPTANSKDFSSGSNDSSGKSTGAGAGKDTVATNVDASPSENNTVAASSTSGASNSSLSANQDVTSKVTDGTQSSVPVTEAGPEGGQISGQTVASDPTPEQTKYYNSVLEKDLSDTGKLVEFHKDWKEAKKGLFENKDDVVYDGAVPKVKQGNGSFFTVQNDGGGYSVYPDPTMPIVSNSLNKSPGSYFFDKQGDGNYTTSIIRPATLDGNGQLVQKGLVQTQGGGSNSSSKKKLEAEEAAEKGTAASSVPSIGSESNSFEAQLYKAFPSVEYDVFEVKSLQIKNPSLQKIPVVELATLKNYTGSGYEAVNKALRSGDQAKIAKFEPYIKAATLGLAKMPTYEGKVYRGTELSEKDLTKYVPGKTVTEEAFTSTTRTKKKQFDGNTSYTIISKTGKKVDSISDVKSEDEVLFHPYTQFNVLSVRKDTAANKYQIFMEEQTND